MFEKSTPLLENNSHITIGNACGDINNQVSILEELASAFSHTGNDAVAKKLFRIAENISNAELIINKTVGEWISQDLKRSTENSNNMILTALAVATKLGK